MRDNMDSKLRLPAPKRILADGTHFARVFGCGEPMLLIHGNMGSGFVFGRVIDCLAAHYTVVLPDLPGHGMGPQMPQNFRTDRQASIEYCVCVMEKLGYSSYIVGGHSLGGIIALQMALDYPKRIKAVLKLDSYICYCDPEVKPKLTLKKYESNPSFLQDLIDEALSFGPGTVWFADFDARKSIGHLTCPVLQLIGESFPNSQETYDSYLQKVTPWHPHSWKVVRVPASGHFIQIEQPEFVCREILSFLKST